MNYFTDNAMKSLGFYVAGSNTELLNRINQLMGDKGHLGVCDPQGHYHYVIDGRKGAPYAARRIEGVAQKFMRESDRQIKEDKFNAEFYVDAVLSCYAFDDSLKGYHFIRYILVQLTLNPALSTSLSKTLYPMTARHFQVEVRQVERNVRYCLHKLKETELLGLPHKHKMLPLMIKDGKPVFQAVKTRVLLVDKDRYKNAEAIRVLLKQVQKLIKRDLYPDMTSSKKEAKEQSL